MRAYFFGNMYLSSIQQGIQAAHATADMFVKYESGVHEGILSERYQLLYDWAENHKTMILLNAGFSETIHELVSFFGNRENPYPWAPFHEGQDALDGALTTVGIVLPEKIYETSRMIRKITGEGRTPYQMLWEDGEIQLFPDNEYGIEVHHASAPLVWEYNKWEALLVEKLNGFGLAS